MKIKLSQLRKIIKEEISCIQQETIDIKEFDIETWVYDAQRTREELVDAHHELTKDVYGVSSSVVPTDDEELRQEIIELQNDLVGVC